MEMFIIEIAEIKKNLLVVNSYPHWSLFFSISILLYSVVVPTT